MVHGMFGNSKRGLKVVVMERLKPCLACRVLWVDIYYIIFTDLDYGQKQTHLRYIKKEKSKPLCKFFD